MIISGHQPSYLPWLGYFHKIINCNNFVYMNSVQFIERDFIHRNYILTRNGLNLLSIPILKKQSDKKLNYSLISNKKIAKSINHLSKQDWQHKHLQSIKHAYSKAPYFKKYWEEIESIFVLYHWDSLDELCQYTLNLFLKILKIDIKIINMRTDLIPSNKKGSDLVLDHCVQLNANKIIFGSQGINYVQKEPFLRKKISLFFQDFKHPVYNQFNSNIFVPKMCILDCIFNVGAEECLNLLQNQKICS